ncbi:hypothetical protein GCM10022251_58770 [Phytohabitans flavus]|uniref:SCO6045-like C-terminal domain-containing protein n=1 Tax=Phytohabitans flavus TaxID=1076124 RepID=A0A6F8XXS8_9ACTN|nr:hypothetical protein [Phytohabitans flavus]BCB78531.1 hypothetical protein Pflav_049410 [Phytohabitans flavus]
MTRPEDSLAERQAALVAALVAGAPIPDGFDPRLIDTARRALLRKRSSEVARHWPMLAASFGERWPTVFAEWAEARPTRGSFQDGLALARSLPLTDLAAEELAAHQSTPWTRLLRRLRPRP